VCIVTFVISISRLGVSRFKYHAQFLRRETAWSISALSDFLTELDLFVRNRAIFLYEILRDFNYPEDATRVKITSPPCANYKR